MIKSKENDWCQHLLNYDALQRHVVPFMDDYLQHDGVFVIRLISKNTTSLVVSEMLAALFHNFQNQQSKDKDKSDEQSQPCKWATRC